MNRSVAFLGFRGYHGEEASMCHLRMMNATALPGYRRLHLRKLRRFSAFRRFDRTAMETAELDLHEKYLKTLNNLNNPRYFWGEALNANFSIEKHSKVFRNVANRESVMKCEAIKKLCVEIMFLIKWNREVCCSVSLEALYNFICVSFLLSSRLRGWHRRKKRASKITVNIKKSRSIKFLPN